ncbi:MAG: RNA-binding domain-containing protein [Chitinophagales bacterium]
MENHLQIKEWIMAGEGRELEFKTRVPAPQKMAKTVCAFANTRGGHIVVGVMDDGEIVGIIDEESEKKLLLEAANYYCEPPVSLHFETYMENYLMVLVAKIEESERKPHAILSKGEELVYVRVKAESLIASKAVTKVLMNEQIADRTPQRALNSREKALITRINERGRITVKEYAQRMNLSKRRARRMLVDLVNEGIIRVHTLEKEDYYTVS